MPGLLLAAENGDLATIKRLRAEGVDVTAKCDTQKGYTAIMFAAMNGHATPDKVLHEAGARAVEKNSGGY